MCQCGELSTNRLMGGFFVPYCEQFRQRPLMLHRLPNGKLLIHDGLSRDLAIKRMEAHERWCEEHREELERDSQELFDQMFGG